MGVSQYYLLGDRRYRPICNQTVKFSAENSVFKNFAKSSLPVSDRTKSERPFAHRSGSVSNVVFSLLFSLIKILKIEINSHPGGVRYNLRWQKNIKMKLSIVWKIFDIAINFPTTLV